MKEYFAQKEAKDVAAEMIERMKSWTDYLGSSNLRDRWRKSYQLYYGRHFQGTYFGQAGVKSAGEQGQLKLVTANHFRNLVKHTLVLATNQKPSFDVRAINADPSSLEQARLGNNILNAYLSEKRLIRYVRVAAEHALIFGKGYVEITWSKTEGRPYSVSEYEDIHGETKLKVEYDGDVDLYNPGPFDVYYDQTLEDFSKMQWYTSRRWQNRWDLCAEHPDLASKILELETKEDMSFTYKNSFRMVEESEDVPVFTFYHKRSPSMPNGRIIIFSDSDTIYYDGPMPYAQLPLRRIVPGDIFQTTEGYSDAFDLIDLQEVYNNLLSSAFTNFNATAVQTILMPNGSNISAQQMGGLRVLKYDPQMGEPKALQLTANPPDLYTALNLVERLLETISGINSVARGNPESSLKSGVALSLVQSMAVQFSSLYQQSWAELLEDTGTTIIQYLKQFAKTERLVATAGKMNQAAMQSFKGSDLDNIERVVVDLGNPMSRTTAGRLEIANNLIQMGLIKVPQEYITVLETGNLEPLTQGTQVDLSTIHAENDSMLSGKPVMALITDAHLLHSQEHRALLSNPEVRKNSSLTKMVLDHIMVHEELYEQQRPFFSQIAGEPPAPPQAPPQPPMGPPPGPMGPPPGMPAGPMGAPGIPQ